MSITFSGKVQPEMRFRVYAIARRNLIACHSLPKIIGFFAYARCIWKALALISVKDDAERFG